MVTVVVPASSANLGPGFDAVGLALGIRAEIGVVDSMTPPDLCARQVDEQHPASIAFRRLDGAGTLWVRSPIPIGRGMGFSGTMRVGGAAAAVAQQSGPGGLASRRGDVLAVAADLEGHADNAAASLYGGIVATDGSRAVRIETALDPDVVIWIPQQTTSTNASRTSLPAAVPFADAVFNIGRTAVLVAALVAGDLDALASATEDRLHQDRRLDGAPESRRALTAGLTAGAWCGWLSGSGPSIAFLTERGGGERLAAALPPSGHTKVTSVDDRGTVVTPA